MTALFRYIGSKAKLARFLVPLLPAFSHYREPFCGTASFAIAYALKHPHTSLWLNDLDPSIIDLLGRILHSPDALSRDVLNFKPTIQNYYRAKYLLKSGSIDGFSRLIIHQLSYIGEGLKGGPRGGTTQRIGVSSRWTVPTLLKRIHHYHGALSGRAKLTNLDFEEVLSANGRDEASNPAEDTLIYIDPPYFNAHNYDLPFSSHQRLAHLLKECPHSWLLSYRDHPQVHQLYSWAHIIEISPFYRSSKFKPELLITTPHLGRLISSQLITPMKPQDLALLRNLLKQYQEEDSNPAIPSLIQALEKKMIEGIDFDKLSSFLAAQAPAPTKGKASDSNPTSSTKRKILTPERAKAIRDKYRALAYTIDSSITLSAAAKEEGLGVQSFTKVLKGESFEDMGPALTDEELAALKSGEAIDK